jgi:hypothetical protein
MTTNPEAATPVTAAGCDIDGNETLMDWALRLADERVEAIIEPHELAHARHRRGELRTAIEAATGDARLREALERLHRGVASLPPHVGHGAIRGIEVIELIEAEKRTALADLPVDAGEREFPPPGWPIKSFAATPEPVDDWVEPGDANLFGGGGPAAPNPAATPEPEGVERLDDHMRYHREEPCDYEPQQ